MWNLSPQCLMKFEMVNESCHEKSRVTAAASEASISDHLSSLIHNNNDAVFLSAAEGASQREAAAATLLNPFIAIRSLRVPTHRAFHIFNQVCWINKFFPIPNQTTHPLVSYWCILCMVAI